MLKTVWLTEKQNTEQSAVMLLGGFDGLHLGHRQLLARAKTSGLSVGVMTIVGGKEDKNLFTFAEREDVFRRAGVDFVLELPFAEIKDVEPQNFLALLEENFSPKLYVCGEDFRFGAGAKGNAETLKTAGTICVDVLPLVEMDGEKISARTVKRYLSLGEVEKANLLLGERFFLLGAVQSGRQVGRTMQFPTANIAYPNEKFSIRQGVYETRVAIDGVVYKGITNYGARPTFEDEEVWTETYLDGFQGDLYGKTLKVEFVRYLRDIQKFENEKSLQKQLQEDIFRVRENR
ncbi:MAG: riboflavin biosynthesis protein RibF [Clostridia bacterium]|nr:riboflavin biosynthesis protein RibF [Clostridia bacterium]